MESEARTKKDRFKSSAPVTCLNGVATLSPDGQLFATKLANQIAISSCSSLDNTVSLPAPHKISMMKFSPDSKFISWLTQDHQFINVFEIEPQHKLEINIKDGLKILTILWGASSLVYISELEVYIGVYDLKRHLSFTLPGCSLDNFDRPLITYSPNDDYLCYVSGHQLVVYDTDTWNIKAEFNCPIEPIQPIFATPYTVFVANSEGAVEWFSIFGSKLKKNAVLCHRSIVEGVCCIEHRTLVASTYDNKILGFDTLAMEPTLEFDYLYNIETKHEVRIFIETDQTKQMGALRIQRFKQINRIFLKEIKNINDEFKRKTELPHMMSLNRNCTHLASYNPITAHTIWVWDLRKKSRLDSVICLVDITTSVKGLAWDSHTDKLAISCTHSVIIWSPDEKPLAFPGDNMNFQWLNISAPVGLLTANDTCRFLYLV